MLIDLTDDEMSAIEVAAARNNPADLSCQPLTVLADKVKDYRRYSNRRHYKELDSTESFGGKSIGVKVWVAIDRELDDEDAGLGHELTSKLKNGLLERSALLDPEMQQHHAELRAACESLFHDQPIYVEEIPNEYWNDWYGVHRPWFIVTTRIGRFKIGWRKRVMVVDWSATQVKATANKLFPLEDVTKDGCLIHAWTIEKARAYITTIMDLANQPERKAEQPA